MTKIKNYFRLGVKLIVCSTFVLFLIAGDGECVGTAPTTYLRQSTLEVEKDYKLITLYENSGEKEIKVTYYLREEKSKYKGIHPKPEFFSGKVFTIQNRNDEPFSVPGVTFVPDTIKTDVNITGNGYLYNSQRHLIELTFNLSIVNVTEIEFRDYELKIYLNRFPREGYIDKSDFILRVLPAGAGDPLKLTLTPPGINIRTGTSDTVQVRVDKSNLITEPVNLKIRNIFGSSIPDGITFEFSNNPLSLIDVVSQLTISVGDNVPIGGYSFEIKAEANGFQETAELAISVSSNWDYQTIISQPPPGGRFFYDVAFRNERGMISGFGGEIFYTVDDGSSWHKSETGTAAHLFGVAAVEQNIFVACGNLKTILRTTNNGGSWTAIENIPGPDNSSLFGIAFEPNQRLIGAVVSSTDVLWTTDAGYNWNITNNFQNQYLLNGGIDFWDENNALITGQVSGGGSPVILRTTNRGQSWNAVQLPTIVGKVSCFGSNLAVAVGSDNDILRTTNKGISWDVINYNKPATAFTSVSFVNENVGTIVGTYKPGSYLQPLVLRTTNGGLTWFEELVFVPQLTNVHLRGVIMTTPEKAFAVGSNYIYRRDP